MYFWFDEEFSDDSIFFCKLTVNNVLFKKKLQSFQLLLNKSDYLPDVRNRVYRVHFYKYDSPVFVHDYIGPLGKTIFFTEEAVFLCDNTMGPEITQQPGVGDRKGFCPGPLAWP